MVTERMEPWELSGCPAVRVSPSVESIWLVLTGRDKVRITESFVFGPKKKITC